MPSEDLDDEINELQSQIETLNSLQSLWLSNGNFQTRGECSYETIENYLESLPTHLEKLRTKQNTERDKNNSSNNCWLALYEGSHIQDRSPIHYGTAILCIDEKSCTLRGEYYTDRNNKRNIYLKTNNC